MIFATRLLIERVDPKRISGLVAMVSGYRAAAVQIETRLLL